MQKLVDIHVRDQFHTLKELDNTLITIRENEALQFLEIKVH